MVPWAGVEPATFPLGGGRAIQLCHQGKIISILTCDFIKIYSKFLSFFIYSYNLGQYSGKI